MHLSSCRWQYSQYTNVDVSNTVAESLLRDTTIRVVHIWNHFTKFHKIHKSKFSYADLVKVTNKGESNLDNFIPGPKGKYMQPISAIAEIVCPAIYNLDTPYL